MKGDSFELWERLEDIKDRLADRRAPSVTFDAAKKRATICVPIRENARFYGLNLDATFGGQRNGRGQGLMAMPFALVAPATAKVGVAAELMLTVKLLVLATIAALVITGIILAVKKIQNTDKLEAANAPSVAGEHSAAFVARGARRVIANLQKAFSGSNATFSSETPRVHYYGDPRARLLRLPVLPI